MLKAYVSYMSIQVIFSDNYMENLKFKIRHTEEDDDE
jgi:hypothetical protein